jgi:sterol desaturase/sphingolipid hydroxylase (fatty acid hydroxylase superfamily)
MEKPYKSVQVFKSPFLERFTHVHPLTPLVLWGPIVSYLLWKSYFVLKLSPVTIGTLGGLGLFIWTLTEYLMHRFVFHFEKEGPIAQRIHFLIHGLHHVDPVDPTRLVMPPALSVTLAAILYGLFLGFLGSEWVVPFFAFYLIGYLCYDYIHFAVHHFVPRTRVGKFLKQSHMMHHYVSSNSRWGVSSPFWDYVFGTLEDVKGKKESLP